jgi:hypothetical protein
MLDEMRASAELEIFRAAQEDDSVIDGIVSAPAVIAQSVNSDILIRVPQSLEFA